MSEKPLKQTKRAEQGSATPGLEWAMSIVGFLIVSFSLGFIAYSAIEGDETPPYVTAKVLKVMPNGTGFLVTIRAENKGATTAAALEIEGALKMPGQEAEETRSLTFSYLPSHSSREGGLFFKDNPNEGVLSLRPVGYQQP